MVEELHITLSNVFAQTHIIGLGASFLAGMLLVFSPCIYPLIPITLGVVGAASESSRLKGFSLSSVFVLGIALVFTVLGIVSAILGVLLNEFLINPITYLILALVFFILAGSYFGIIKLKIPSISPNYNYDSKKGLLAVFSLGLVSGLAIIPCSFPILGAILNLIAIKGDVFYGGLALFLFALGYGVILIILGTFTSLIRRLPRRSLLAMVVHKIVGLILVAIGVYFLWKFKGLVL